MQAFSSQERDRVRQRVEDACRPVAQSWPLKTFAYRNPLRGLENLPFDEAIRVGQQTLGGNGYLSNEEYRQIYRDNAITDASIDQTLDERNFGDLPESITLDDRVITRRDVCRQHLLFGLEPLEPALLEWTLHAGGALRNPRRDLPRGSRAHSSIDLTQLWSGVLSLLELTDDASTDRKFIACESEVTGENFLVNLPDGQTLSDWLQLLTTTPLVQQINDQMIKWSAAFLDEGMADWQMSGRHGGFYHAWRELARYDYSGRVLGVRRSGKKIRDLPDSPEDAITLALSRLGVPEHRQESYLSRLLTQLPGWTGFIRWRGESVGYHAQQEHPIDAVQYLAVRLFYEVELVEMLCQREFGIEGTQPALIAYWQTRPTEYARLMNHPTTPMDASKRAICRDGWRLFHLAQFLELTLNDVSALGSANARTLLGWLDGFPAHRHGEVWLSAMEISYRDRLLGTLLDQSRDHSPIGTTESSCRAQIVFCIDVRSEPMRRNVEASGPYQTLGFAGFFGLPINYLAFDSENAAALCPVILSPHFAVEEIPRDGQQDLLQSHESSRRWNDLGQQLFHHLKRNAISSLMLIDVMGVFFGLKLVGKTFFRRRFDWIQTWVRERFGGTVATRIPVDFQANESPDAVTSLPLGLPIQQQAASVAGALRAIGLTNGFGRFIVLCGHGSTSENNPYFAAYNCGACGGGHGDANARAFASMGNNPDVRRLIREGGLDIPDDTWFLAAKHNTVTDTITFYDTQEVPHSHVDDLSQMIVDLSEATSIQAQQRSHHLPQVPQDLSLAQARDQMIGRSVDWANVRPEWGLSGNAAFILGRRSLTNHVELGGRVFLHSYDPHGDNDGAILEALMTAPLVVAQWISMEYYFSAVDPWRYGSGSKVTHNVVSGVGVMHGAHGDLQSGLPLQSVNDGTKKYHQPVRLLTIIESPTSRIESAIAKHTVLQQIIHNQWIHLVAVDPDTGQFQRYRPDSQWERLS